jgi:catechol 2,3-dioxygenase-like lactoylglutathione lyase family enzyme
MMQTISRRGFIFATGAALVAPRITFSANQVPKLLDHILLGCSDLDRGIDFVYEQTGVRAAFGGVHPGNGTQNALLSLADSRYLEIIAPDPKQPPSADTLDLRSLDDDPALVGWAAHHADLDAFAARLKSQGFTIEGPTPGSRKRPDGRLLTWKALRLKDDPTRLLPFFIEWSANSIHPSVDSPQGCHLVRFEAFAPDTDARLVSGKIEALGLDLPLADGEHSLLVATIAGPKGQLEVTS